MQFFLLSTAHLRDAIWFKDPDDFKAGMNTTAVLAATTSVKILAFVLMSNHVHYVLQNSKEEAEAFIVNFKKTYSQKYSKKYGATELLRNNPIHLEELTLGDESLEKAIAYVMMNPYQANLVLKSEAYPWGCGSLYFNVVQNKGTNVGEMSARHLIKCIGSRKRLPENYVINYDGYVDPASYVQVKFVESLYRTPKRMDYFLKTSSKAQLNYEGVSFDDQTIIAGMRSLCYSLFRTGRFSDLSDMQQSKIVDQLSYRFSAQPKQIARVSGLSPEKVCQLLDAFKQN